MHHEDVNYIIIFFKKTNLTGFMTWSRPILGTNYALQANISSFRRSMHRLKKEIFSQLFFFLAMNLCVFACAWKQLLVIA